MYKRFSDWSTGKKKLTQAFKLLRKEGLIAKQNFACCMSCGCSEISMQADERKKKFGKTPKGYVFYHRQDTDSLETYGSVHLRFGGFYTRNDRLRKESLSAVEVGKLIVEKMKEVGLKTEWDGTEDKCIQVDVEGVGFNFNPFK